jgi:hypothetical protein
VPPFEGDAVDYFRLVYRDVSMPTELRLVAAKCAANFERASLSPAPAPASGSDPSLEDLVRRALAATPEERLARAESLIKQYSSLAPPVEIQAQPEPGWAAIQRRIEELHQQIVALELEHRNDGHRRHPAG